MPLIERNPPAAVVKAIVGARDHIGAFPPVACRAGLSRQGITFALPLQVFWLGLRSLESGAGLEAARWHGWRAFVAVKTKPVAMIEVVESRPPRRAYRFSGITAGPWVRVAASAVTKAERALGNETENYEPRLLVVPGLGAAALWLKPKRGRSDALIPILSMPWGRTGVLRPAESLLDGMRAAVPERSRDMARHLPRRRSPKGKRLS